MLGMLQLDRHRSARSAVALLMVLILAVVSSGLPLPSGTKKTGERFPCENYPCGCRTAEQCWSNCCCHTPAQRLAWAERQGVAPPPSARAQAKNATPSCCTKSRCCSTPAASEPTASDSAESETPHDLQTVGWRALACQGHTAGYLVAIPVPVVTPDRLAWPHQCRWLGPILSEAAPSDSRQPPQPPPRSLIG